MDVLLTGAHGTVGTALRRELDDRYDVTPMDVVDGGEDTIVADMRDYETLRDAFEGRDAVVHLAIDPELNWQVTDVAWSDALAANLQGIVTAYRAAIDAGVDRFVYASSIHTVGTYACEFDGSRDPGNRQFDHADRYPDSLYAVSKLFGEALGQFCAEYHSLRCYCLRLGAAFPTGYDYPHGWVDLVADTGEDPDRATADSLAAEGDANWLSHRDLGQLVACCLDDRTVDFDVFYGVSDNDDRRVDLSHAREVLGYEPRDNAAEWDERRE
jgi:nucleoside-diphosphate-sugar epimerase